MKKLFFIFSLTLLLTTSCDDAKIYDAVVIEQINVLENQNYKYEVKLHTAANSGVEAFYYTDYRFQVGDSLISYYQFFESKNNDIRVLKKQNDSLRKELITVNYYLEILKERVIIDTLKKK